MLCLSAEVSKDRTCDTNDRRLVFLGEQSGMQCFGRLFSYCAD